MGEFRNGAAANDGEIEISHVRVRAIYTAEHIEECQGIGI